MTLLPDPSPRRTMPKRTFLTAAIVVAAAISSGTGLSGCTEAIELAADEAGEGPGRSPRLVDAGPDADPGGDVDAGHVADAGQTDRPDSGPDCGELGATCDPELPPNGGCCPRTFRDDDEDDDVDEALDESPGEGDDDDDDEGEALSCRPDEDAPTVFRCLTDD